MTQTARMYGGSLYELAVEEQLVEAIGGQMEEIRQIFHENADYMKLLSCLLYTSPSPRDA